MASLPDGIEYRERILRMAEDFVTELAGIAGARDDYGDAIKPANAAYGETEPAELV
jgi:hypothetical protein